jgi:putative copper export protein
LKWTWAAFALTALTGGLMFITNAVVYFHNTYFRAKMILLVLAGLNMLVFELTARRTIQQWDSARSTPRAAKVVATVSLIIWVGVIVAGRVIGFTATRAATPVDETAPAVDFEDLLGLPK